MVKTKMMFIIAFAFAFLATNSNTWLYSFSGGDGTQANPYQISSLADWLIFADSVHNSPNNQTTMPGNWSYGKYFELNQGIDTVRISVGRGGGGDGHVPNASFEGHFDGKNNKITIGIISSTSGALFNYISKATIKNLLVDGYVITSEFGAGIVAFTNNYFRPNDTSLKNTIINCTNYATVNTNLTAGGIAAEVFTTDIENCINAGKITSAMGPAGGICATLVGYAPSIKGCINIGNITGYMHVGGVTGVAIGTVTNNINYGYVNTNSVFSEIGGIIGMAIQDTIVSNNFNSGVVSAPAGSNIGCIIGRIRGNVTLQNNHYDKQMCGEPEPSELGE